MSLLITSFSRFSFFLNFFSQRNVLSEERSRRSSFLPKKSTKGPLSFFFRSKKKVVRGKIRCQLNSYWTGRTGRRHGFGSFPPRCGAEGVWSRTVWVRRVTDPLTHLLQSSLIFFFLLERKFFKEGAGRGGEERGKRVSMGVRVWEGRTRTTPYSVERLEAIFVQVKISSHAGPGVGGCGTCRTCQRSVRRGCRSYRGRF